MAYKHNNPEELGSRLKRHKINSFQGGKVKSKLSIKSGSTEEVATPIEEKKLRYDDYLPFNKQNARKPTDIGYLLRKPSKESTKQLL